MEAKETMLVIRKGFEGPVKILVEDFDPKTDKAYKPEDEAGSGGKSK